jgi:deoxyadenosine/deoxycytidine kinase
MVATVTGPQHEQEPGCRRALIMEIIGPAGAGKTTLFRALERLDPGIQTEFLPPVWNFGYIPFFVKNILLLLPTLVRMQERGDRNLTRRELAWMAMLMGWPKILRKEAENGNKKILLDQGPIFLMAVLYEFGPQSLRNSNIQGYWENVYEQWVHTLNMVILLDTSDEILLERIRTRSDDHLMKNKADQEIKEFLVKYRQVYERLITIITTMNPAIKVLRLDTGKNSVEDLVRDVLLNLPLENGVL